MSRNALAALSIVLTATACSQRAPTREGPPMSLRAECYSVEVLPFDSLAEPVAIDDRGRVLITTFGALDSYLWDGARRDLRFPAGTNHIKADMNRRGDIVGVAGACGEDGCAWEHIGLFAWHDGEPTPLPSPDGTLTRAVFLNELGHFAGTFDHADGSLHAFLSTGGKPIDLGPGVAYDINDADDVVGEADGRAVIWRGGTKVDLGRPAGMGSSFGFGRMLLNRRGEVAATAPGPTGYARAFFWSDGWTDLTGGPALTAAATGLDDRGDVVGYASATNVVPFEPDAFLWKGGTTTRLTAGEAHHVNQRGQIVGYDRVHDSAFVWDAGTLIDLPKPSAMKGERTSAALVNESGVVVGSVGFSYGASIALWKPDRCGDGGAVPPPPPIDAGAPEAPPPEEPIE